MEVVRCRITGTAAKATSQRLHVVAHGFDDVYAGPGLTPPQRQLVTLGALTAMGGCEPSCACAKRSPGRRSTGAPVP